MNRMNRNTHASVPGITAEQITHLTEGPMEGKDDDAYRFLLPWKQDGRVRGATYVELSRERITHDFWTKEGPLLKRVIAWIRSHGAEHGVDSDLVVTATPVAGGSAWMANVEPGRLAIAWSTLANVCSGCEAPTLAPACRAGSSTAVESAPLQWTTLWPGRHFTSEAMVGMAPSGVVMKTRSLSSATAWADVITRQPETSNDSRPADSGERLYTALTW